MTALLIEGDVRHAQLLRNLLSDEGLQVEHLRDGLQAKRRLREGPRPSLVVTGLSVPGADGFAVLRALRAVATPEQTPAIVVSSFLELRTRATALKTTLGITAVLPRDVSAVTLQRILRRTLSGATSPQEHTPAPVDPLLRQAKEARRLATIAELDLLDDAPDEYLQAIVKDTAKTFDVATALVCLVLEDRQWFKAHTGLTGRLAAERGTTRDVAFCSHVVESTVPLVVQDAATHPVFQSNPSVRDGTVRAYVGAPLTTSQGVVLGTLSLFDSKPRTIPPEMVDALSLVARRVAGEFELRAARKRDAARDERVDALQKEASAAKAAAALGKVLGHAVDALPEAIIVYGPDRRIVFSNWAAEQMFVTPKAGLVGVSRDEFLTLQSPRFDDPEVFIAALAVAPEGPWASSLDFEMQRPTPTTLRWTSSPVVVEDAAYQLTRFVPILQPAGTLAG